MQFKNATFFNAPRAWLDSLTDLPSALDEKRAKPLDDAGIITRGFISPIGQEDGALVLEAMGFVLMTQEIEQRKLNNGALNRALERKLKALEAERGMPVKSRERKQIKLELAEHQLRHTPPTAHRTHAILDPSRGVLIVDTASQGAAEAWVATLREALGSAPLTPLTPTRDVPSVLTQFLTDRQLPGPWRFGAEFELFDPSVPKHKIVATEIDLLGEEIDQHLEAGRRVARLGLALEEKFGFVLTRELTLRKLRTLDGLREESANAADADSLAGVAAAELVIYGQALGQILDTIRTAFAVPTAEPLFETEHKQAA